MKKLVTTMFLICAAMLLFSPQAGFAYENVNQGCLGCHPTTAGTGLHNIAAHSSCGTCHPGGAPGKNVESSACIVCHPRTGDKGLCPLIDAPVHASTKQTCLGCHTTCAPANTTTTVTPTTTTTTPAGPCPAEAVLGEGDPRLDTLRTFRDQVLAKNPNGQKMIKMYYDSSAAVVQMLEKDPALKQSAREYLESILPTIELMTKHKAIKK
jgi:hypothetical protein